MTPRELLRFETAVLVEPNSYCWLWTLAVNTHGYGQFTTGSRVDGSRRIRLAHRVSYEHFNGPVGDGLFVCHRCDVRACVNPAHLFIGTNTDNMRDASRKGRLARRGDPRRARGERNGHAKLTDASVRTILSMRRRGTIQRVIAERFGVSRSMVAQIVRGEKWQHLLDCRDPQTGERLGNDGFVRAEGGDES